MKRANRRGLAPAFFGDTNCDVDECFRPDALNATAATNVLDHAADIAHVQKRLGHANIATTRI